MSENQQNEIVQESPARLKRKNIIPIIVIAIAVMIVASLFSNDGDSMNKQAVSALMEQNPQKVLACVPEDFRKTVMEGYGLDESELNDAIEMAHMITTFNEVRKITKLGKLHIITRSNVTPEKVEKNKSTSVMLHYYKNPLTVIEGILETDDFEKVRRTGFHVKAKEDDGTESTEEFTCLSARYNGEWYSLDCMAFLVIAGNQYASTRDFSY